MIRYGAANNDACGPGKPKILFVQPYNELNTCTERLSGLPAYSTELEGRICLALYIQNLKPGFQSHNNLLACLTCSPWQP